VPTRHSIAPRRKAGTAFVSSVLHIARFGAPRSQESRKRSELGLSVGRIACTLHAVRDHPTTRTCLCD